MAEPSNIDNLIVVGAGGHGSEVLSYLRTLQVSVGGPRLVGFVDEVRKNGPWEGTEVLGDFDALTRHLAGRGPERYGYHLAVGSPDLRRRFFARLSQADLQSLLPWTLVHPGAIIGRDVTLALGVLVAPGGVLTTRIVVGAHSIINVGVSISHGCALGEFVTINPGARLCGDVQVGDGVTVGAGATVIEKISLGNGAVIGAGAVVIDDVPPGVTVAGVPARPITRRAAVGHS